MAGTLALWYRRRFNLPPNDPRFLSLTPGEIVTEYWAHHYDDLYSHGKLDAEFDNPDFEADWEQFMTDENTDWEDVE